VRNHTQQSQNYEYIHESNERVIGPSDGVPVKRRVVKDTRKKLQDEEHRSNKQVVHVPSAAEILSIANKDDSKYLLSSVVDDEAEVVDD
jgi:hypothetical protein